MILSTRLQMLQGREQELQTEIRTLNRQLAEADARNNVRNVLSTLSNLNFALFLVGNSRGRPDST